MPNSEAIILKLYLIYNRHILYIFQSPLPIQIFLVFLSLISSSSKALSGRRLRIYPVLSFIALLETK